MTDVAVRIESIGKQYRIGTHRTPGTVLLREALTDLGAAPFRKLRKLGHRLISPSVRAADSPERDDYVWALRNVSFTVPSGQIIGIIGPNGAGKSTLLKILSRITDPTEGRVEIRGRVGSLLEVGTGFHPELTGLENIFLSGALLGMRKVEIERNLDEIVAFSEIDKFIDTPVKYYSSGMYVRLAFAVAAHLEPEILIIDEVLAVGDVAFQRKCLNKMEDVRQHGRTILFVSHSMQAVTRLCDRALLISGGTIKDDGPASEIAGQYLLTSFRTGGFREWTDIGSAPGDEIVRLRSVRIRDESGNTIESLDVRHPVGLEMVYDVLEEGHALAPTYHVYNESGTCLFATLDLEPEWRDRARQRGRFTSVAWIPANFLAEGAVLVTPAISTLQPAFKIHVYEHDAVAFHVWDRRQGDSARGDYDGTIPGVVRPLLTWNTTFVAW
jgi:lipopolysaccharide transport system ATP-binding protein